MRRGTATLLVASMLLSYTALFAWRANLDLSNHLFFGVVSNSVLSGLGFLTLGTLIGDWQRNVALGE